MRLQKLPEFIASHFAEPRPTPRTVKGWKGAIKIGGEWYMDLDVWPVTCGARSLAETLLADPRVAELVG